ncbi:hypothetical protein MMC30_006020 [Trapelia coarctata]|nr:hypothetical protein [Trapelia coarctata]
MASSLLKRYYCSSYSYYNSYNDCYSPWDSYGRWVLLGCVIVGAFLLFLAFSCITARRRRAAGRNPYPMTAWAGRPPPYNHNQHPQQQNFGNQYGNQQYPQQGANAPPVYSPPGNKNYYAPNNGSPAPNTYPANNGSNQGYFGGQQSGIELQAPGNSYQPTRDGQPVYAAPEGPPPGKHDGIIR